MMAAGIDADALREAIPQSMQAVRRWLLWASQPAQKEGGKRRKVPYYTTGVPRHGELDGPEDASLWATFEQALGAAAAGGQRWAGLGFVLGPDGTGGHWQGIDLDNLPAHPELQGVVDNLPGYTERSPSGQGMHAIGYGAHFDALGSNASGIEAYAAGRFFTVTGDGAGLGEPVCIAAFVQKELRPWHGQPRERQEGIQEGVQGGAIPAYIPGAEIVTQAQISELRSALECLSSDGYHDWIGIGQALRGLGDAGYRLWDEWSQTSDKYDPTEQGRKWATFKGERTSYPSIFARAQRMGWINPGAATAQRAGGGSLADSNAAAPPALHIPHPLERFVALGDTHKPPRWVVPGFIAEGVVLLAGGHGVGKTSALLPLAMAVAGFHESGYPLAPKRWRHVVYITEDTDQARRIVTSVARHCAVSTAAVGERLHLVEAVRGAPLYVVQVGDTYRRMFTRDAEGVELAPLVVFDTQAATLSMESENDNAEASGTIAALKQQFAALPVWLVTHTGKVDRFNPTPTARGASAFEADAHQILYLTRDAEGPTAQRWIRRGKTRFESPWECLALECYDDTLNATNEWGEPEPLAVRYAIARPCEQSPQQERQEREQARHLKEEAELRQSVRDAVQVAWQEGHPLNRAGVKSKVRRKSEEVGRCIESLLAESWLLEIDVPAKLRANNKRSSFLVNLDTPEREAVRRGEPAPLEKTAIPQSWKKQIPSVPEQDGQKDQNEAVLLQNE